MSVSDFWKSKLPDRRVIPERVYGDATRPKGSGVKHGERDHFGPRMLSMRAAGCSIREIAKNFGMPMSTCNDIMRRTQKAGRHGRDV